RPYTRSGADRPATARGGCDAGGACADGGGAHWRRGGGGGVADGEQLSLALPPARHLAERAGGQHPLLPARAAHRAAALHAVRAALGAALPATRATLGRCLGAARQRGVACALLPAARLVELAGMRRFRRQPLLRQRLPRLP